MPSDYDRIRGDNMDEYGKGTRHLEFLGRLYSDRTHFIYELLQNAEDARASTVSFVLEPTRLVFKHDGKELFNEKHVRGVCGVAEGTKAEDETKIGKFGIGFKSVYAYTRTPEIHCGDEHFRIEHFVRPTAADQVAVGSPWTTLFIFPFAQEAGGAPAQAFAAIKQRLSTIGVHTLLFLRNLREIQWEVTGGARGLYRSHSKPSPKHRRVDLKAFSDTAPGASAPQVAEDWLVFERPLSIPGKTVTFNVEAAFRLAKDQKTGKESIQRLTNAPLVVYFPTAIQTGLGFLIQGPYRTTPARDNIEEDHPLNIAMLSHTGELIVEALRTIKEMDLLTIEVLSALPLKQTLDNAYMSLTYGFRPEASREEKLFAPITTRVAKALKEEELLPAYPTGFVAGNTALLARTSDLRELLTPDQLQALLGTNVRHRWLTEDITADRTASFRAYLMASIGVQELTPEGLAQKLTKEFLLLQPDEWLVSFYSFSGLPDGFLPSEAVCRHFQMEFVSVSQLAEKTGIPLSDLETLKTLIQSSPQTWEKIKQSLSGPAGAVGKPKFPERAVRNPERREEKVRGRTGESSDKRYEPRDRSVRTSKPDLDPQTWLQAQYTNEDSQMICQMCESEMPFKKRDGNYYFEAVEAFGHLPIERQEVYLALCPLCAAIYKEYVKRDETSTAAFKNVLLSATDLKLPVQIGQQQKTLHFVETHVLDLRVILGGRPAVP